MLQVTKHTILETTSFKVRLFCYRQMQSSSEDTQHGPSLPIILT